jgi:hypothetical protein
MTCLVSSPEPFWQKKIARDKKIISFLHFLLFLFQTISSPQDRNFAGQKHARSDHAASLRNKIPEKKKIPDNEKKKHLRKIFVKTPTTKKHSTNICMLEIRDRIKKYLTKHVLYFSPNPKIITYSFFKY